MTIGSMRCCLGMGAMGMLACALAVGCAASSSDPLDMQDLATTGPDMDLGGAVDLRAGGSDLAMAGDMAVPPGGNCNPANETLGALGGPDTCPYGQLCSEVTSKCAAAPVGSCAMASGAPTWNKAAKSAPVIVKATASLLASTSATTECLNGDPAALVTVDFYAPQNLTTKDVAADFLKQVSWKKSSVASDTWYPGTFVRMLPPKNQKFGSFQVGINCGGAGGLAKMAALYIADEGARTSNAVCISW